MTLFSSLYVHEKLDNTARPKNNIIKSSAFWKKKIIINTFMAAVLIITILPRFLIARLSKIR